MGRVVNMTPVSRRIVSGALIMVERLTWDDGGLSFEVYRVDGDKVTDLTENGCFDHEPTDEEIESLLDNDEIDTSDVDEYDTGVDTVLEIDVAQIVKGQEITTTCGGCGDWITLYDGEWYHIFNPKLTGNDDHDANPD